MSGHSRPLRVLWLTKGLGPGGAERLLLSLAQAGHPERVTYEVAYLLPWKDHLVEAFETAGVRVHALRAPRQWDPRWLVRFRRLLTGGDFDVLHVHSPLSGSLARVAVRTMPRSRRPGVVSTEHNVWDSHRKLTRWLNRLTLPLGDVDLAVSEEVSRSMSPRRRRHTEVLLHGIAVADVEARRVERLEARRELGVGDDEVVVGTVANLRTTKDYPNLLRAARAVVDRHVPVRFLAVGQGPLEAELAAERDRLGLGDHFRFLGYQEDPIRVLVACDLFTLASRHEGLPVALMEALGAGLPVVVTAVGGMPSAVRDGVEGRVVPPGRPDLLADAIEILATDTALRQRMGAAAARRSGDFDIRVTTRRLEALYGRVAAV